MAGTNIEDIHARRALQERAQLMNDTPPQDLAAVFLRADFEGLNAYQWEAFIPGPENSASDSEPLIKKPLPADFRQRYTSHTSLLTHNKAMYDDQVEDEIGADPIVSHLIAKREPRNPDRDAAVMDALRARRTTIAFLHHVGSSAAHPEIAVGGTAEAAPGPSTQASQANQEAA